jgi:hypothetical protein
MTPATFQWDAITWLRDRANIATEMRPGDRVDDPDGPSRIHGFVVHPSRAGTLGFAGLWVLTLGIVLAMLGMPGLPEPAEALMHRLGEASLLAGAGLLLAGWLTLRRHRDRALVELHPAAAGRATASSITALHRDANGAAAWLVAEQPPEPEALEAAAKLGVRCFVPQGDGFAAVDRAAS